MQSYLHQCGLYIVGSSVSGFGGESSDMDLCLVISSYEIDQRFHALEYLYRVQKALSQYRMFHSLSLFLLKTRSRRIRRNETKDFLINKKGRFEFLVGSLWIELCVYRDNIKYLPILCSKIAERPKKKNGPVRTFWIDWLALDISNMRG